MRLLRAWQPHKWEHKWTNGLAPTAWLEDSTNRLSNFTLIDKWVNCVQKTDTVCNPLVRYRQVVTQIRFLQQTHFRLATDYEAKEGQAYGGLDCRYATLSQTMQ